MSSGFLFTSGVVSRAPDTPPVSTFLESHPGAYTTTRSQNNGSSLLFWERHMKRLCDSIRILSNSNPQLFFDHQESAQSLPFPFLSLKCPESTVWEIVNDSMKKLWPIVLKERNTGEEFSVTTLVSGNLEKMNNEKWGSELVAEALDVYVYVGSYVPPKFGIPGNGANLAVVGRGRDVAKAKYSDWVRIRKHLEKLRPPSATELLLSNDGDHILEGSVSNFFVVCRKDKTDAMEKSLGVSHSLDCFEVQTGSIGDGILPGIIRQLVREICLTKGISFREVAPSWSEHETWEEAFITNSLRLLQHVEAICIPSSWDSLESRSLEDITWDNKQFKEGPGLITTIIQGLKLSIMADAPTSPAGGSHESGGEQSPHAGTGGGVVREQDRYLPIANISRIMKKGLPANGKIAKDAKDTVQECVSEFISFITSEASDKCQKEKRKTINGDDILWAMSTLGFEDYIDPLRLYLTRYRELEGDTKGSARGGDSSAKREAVPAGTGHNRQQFVHQGALSYMNSQAQHMIVPSMQGNDQEFLASDD